MKYNTFHEGKMLPLYPNPAEKSEERKVNSDVNYWKI